MPVRRFPASLTARVVGVVLIAGAAMALANRDAGASIASYSAVASADSVRVTLANPSVIPLGQEVDPGAAAAQVSLDAVGGSSGFASAPFPGNAPVEIAPMTGARYPLHVQSSHPTTPKAEMEAGALSLLAESDEMSSRASARAGVDSESFRTALTTASASAQAKADKVVVAATTRTEGISVGDALSIAWVRSSVEVVRLADGTLHRTSQFRIGGASVGGQPVELTEKGFVLGGGEAQPVEVPVADALAEAGIVTRYLQPTENEDGVVGAGLEIAVMDAASSTKVVYTLGRVAAAVGGSVGGASAAELSEGGGGSVLGGAGTGAASLDLLGQGTGATLEGEPPTGGTGSTPAGRPPSAVLTRATSPTLDLPSTAAIYLTIAVGAVLALGGTQLIRFVGVRARWT